MFYHWGVFQLQVSVNNHISECLFIYFLFLFADYFKNMFSKEKTKIIVWTGVHWINKMILILKKILEIIYLGYWLYSFSFSILGSFDFDAVN